MELNLREHQLKVIDSLREGFKAGHRTQVLYAPTGFGKTEIAIYLMKATADKGYRAAMVLDRLVSGRSNKSTPFQVRARSWRHAGRPLEIQFIGVDPGVLCSDT
jgi:hypothetical protein